MFGKRVPGGEQSPGEFQAGFSELPLGCQAFAVEPEVALKVRLIPNSG
jgi:hypothetical protein